MKMKGLNEWAEQVNNHAWEKKWHSDDEDVDHFIERFCNNEHDEVSELHEAWRNNKLFLPCDKKGLDLNCAEEELADIIIRALDCAKKFELNIERAVILKDNYNTGRPDRHGGKRS